METCHLPLEKKRELKPQWGTVTTIKMAKIEKTDHTKCDEDVE